MNTENSKTTEPHQFRLTLADKLDLKHSNKNMALVNLGIYYTWKNILKFLLQLGMINLIFLMHHILFQKLKIISSALLKKEKL